MKLLVLGANGMAGHMIATYFVEQGNEVVGFDRLPSPHCTRSVFDAITPYSKWVF